ncbi:MAG: molecular chaperone TorD family protein [Coriobacteriales bacterium]|jgi:TorA maturation chaperone TorD|nr:molecular chaperone TorD family protein [Coriobacteriales bacterium]
MSNEKTKSKELDDNGAISQVMSEHDVCARACTVHEAPASATKHEPLVHVTRDVKVSAHGTCDVSAPANSAPAQSTDKTDFDAQAWLNKAALFEILAMSWQLPKQELAQVLASGEYGEAMQELAELNGLCESGSLTAQSTIFANLQAYKNSNKDVTEPLFHELRIEFTRLLVGAPEPVVSPFAGVWWANEAGVQPLLFVNKESMAVERFMRSCGIGQAEGKNEPLDHIGTELEFLQYLCLLRANAVQHPEGITPPQNAYEDFYQEHFIGFARKFAAAAAEKTKLPFYRSCADILMMLPTACL